MTLKIINRSLPLRNAWFLWHFGDRGSRIRPYKSLTSLVDMRGDNKTSYSKLVFVMSLLPDPPAGAVVVETGDGGVWAAVDNSIVALLAEIYPQGVPRRAATNSYLTIYDRVKAHRANTTEAAHPAAAGAVVVPAVAPVAVAGATARRGRGRAPATAARARAPAAQARVARASAHNARTRTARSSVHAAARVLVAVGGGGMAEDDDDDGDEDDL